MSDETDWERRWIKACRTIGGLEQENERLREALTFSKAMIDSLQETVARLVTERDIARAALEAKP